jgi:hypothetical protein
MPRVNHELKQAMGAEQKRPYQSARLKVYGAVRHLTMSGTGAEVEPGEGMGMQTGLMNKQRT